MMSEDVKMSEDAEKALQQFKDAWIGKRLAIVGIEHPHRGANGEAIDVEYTNVGWGLKVRLDDGLECFVFRGTDCRELRIS